MMRVTMSLLLLSLTAAGALAQDKGEPVIGKQKGVKMAHAECQAVWEKANPTKKDKISAGQAQPFIADIAAANTNGDGSIDQSEFTAACDKGLMKPADSMKTPGSSAASPTPGGQ